MLRTLQQLQIEHEAYRDRLRAEVAEPAPAAQADKSG